MAYVRTEPVATSATGVRLFENPYGHFTSNGDFVITDILTPRPWINVLSNDKYGVVISQAGGGFSWANNCQIYRLSRWEQDLVEDSYGRFVYVQDLDEPANLWSTSYQPTRKRAELDEVSHSLGSTTFTRRFLGLDVKQTVFVPLEDCAEVWIIEVRNLGANRRTLRLGSYMEWHLGGIGDWHREFHRLFMESRVHGNTLIAWKHPGLIEHKRSPIEEPIRAFASWSVPEPVTWITDKQAWLGRCGDASFPAAFKQVPRSSITSRWDDPVAGALFDLELGPGETRKFVLTMGAGPNEDSCLAVARKFTTEMAAAELERTSNSWRTRCAAGYVETGDTAIDLMCSTWLPYQAIAGRLDAKCAYYQQGGAYGYRDQLQDSLMLLDSDPGRTLVQLGRHAEAMYEDGGVRHW